MSSWQTLNSNIFYFRSEKFCNGRQNLAALRFDSDKEVYPPKQKKLSRDLRNKTVWEPLLPRSTCWLLIMEVFTYFRDTVYFCYSLLDIYEFDCKFTFSMLFFAHFRKNGENRILNLKEKLQDASGSHKNKRNVSIMTIFK